MKVWDRGKKKSNINASNCKICITLVISIPSNTLLLAFHYNAQWQISLLHLNISTFYEDD